MNNFFFNTSDYSLFKKALRTTENEPVVINILSTDSSLQKDESKSNEPAAARKNMSRKYEPSPFGKFFGPRKQQAVSVDMKDFSSWKNKNYRKQEANINDFSTAESRFSISDFMGEKSQNKFNELDQAKSDMQKPIDQLSTSDPLYKRFSLDSYMHKLEEQTLVKSSFEENDDILEPLGDQTQSVVPDSSQDENFGFGSNVNIEDVSFDDNISGEQFKFEQEELDKFRARLDKIEREAANIKEKSTQKVIETNELSDLSGGFNIENLTDDSEEENSLVDDVESVNAKLSGVDEDNSNKEAPSIVGKRFFEINKTETPIKKKRQGLLAEFDTDEDTSSTETASQDGQAEEISGFGLDSLETTTEESAEVATDETAETTSDVEIPVVEETDKVDGEDDADDELPVLKSEEDDLGLDDLLDESLEDDDEDIVPKKTKADSNVVTKDDLNLMRDELVGKFTEIYQKDTPATEVIQPAIDPSYVDVGTTQIGGGYVYPEQQFVPQETFGIGPSVTDEANQLKAQLQELINSNKMLDLEKEERLRQAELEKEKVAAEYESRIREMEKSFKQSYEDFKKQAYLDKLDRDIKLKEAESKFKKKTAIIKEQEKESYTKQRTGAMLRKELKSYLNISNLEMDKKLLEVASHLNKSENEKLYAEKQEMARKLEEEQMRSRIPEEPVEEFEEEEEIEEEEETPKKKTTTRKTTTRKRKTTSPRTSSARRRSTNRRKIDSDIIGGIDFE